MWGFLHPAKHYRCRRILLALFPIPCESFHVSWREPLPSGRWLCLASARSSGETRTCRGACDSYRVPCLIRWPGVIQPLTIINDIDSHQDMFPTLLSAAENITEDLSKGAKVGDTTVKARIDGYHLLPSFKGAESPQHEFPLLDR